jgi:hypothetical protein
VKELAQAMAKLFSWAKETEGLDHKLENFCETIGLMAQQATECAVFIKNYASRGFLGVSQGCLFAHWWLIFVQTFPLYIRANAK